VKNHHHHMNHHNLNYSKFHIYNLFHIDYVIGKLKKLKSLSVMSKKWYPDHEYVLGQVYFCLVCISVIFSLHEKHQT
jgi:hypothetical protein